MKRTEWLILAAGAILIGLASYFTHPTLFENQDYIRIHGFYKTYLSTALASGRFPQWNPHVALGRPFMADMDAALFYPPTWAYALFDQRLAAMVVTIAHLFLGLFGLVRLARAVGVDDKISIASAFVFIASAPIVSSYQSGVINYGNALCYLPLALALAIELQDSRSLRCASWLALVFGFQLLSGHPQVSWLTGVATVLIVLGRRLESPWRQNAVRALQDLVRLAAAVGGGLAVAAAQVLPLMELMGQSNRHASSVAFSASYALNPIAFGSLVVPGGPLFQAHSPEQLYVGTLTALCAVCGLALWRDRGVRALMLMAMVAALISVGELTPFFTFFYYVIPGLSNMRIPSRASVLISLPVALMAGIFLSKGWQRPRAVVTLWAAAAATLAASSLFLKAVLLNVSSLASLMRAPWIAAAALLTTLWHCADALTSPRTRRLLGVALLLLAAWDMSVSTMGLKTVFLDTSTFPAEPKVRVKLEALGLFSPTGVPPRVWSPLPFVRENAGMTDGYSTPCGYVALQLGRVWDHIHTMQGLVPPLGQNTFAEWPPGAGPFPFNTMNLSLGTDGRAHRLVPNTDVDPRAYVTLGAEVVADSHAANVRMRAGHDFHAVALVEAPITAFPARAPEGLARAQAAITAFAAERIEINVIGTTPGLLVLAEPWYPGWKATINGQDAPVVPANGWMRAVPVPAGSNTVVFRYRSTYLWHGIAVSLSSLALIVAMLLRTGGRRVGTAPNPV